MGHIKTGLTCVSQIHTAFLNSGKSLNSVSRGVYKFSVDNMFSGTTQPKIATMWQECQWVYDSILSVFK